MRFLLVVVIGALAGCSDDAALTPDAAPKADAAVAAPDARPTRDAALAPDAPPGATDAAVGAVDAPPAAIDAPPPAIDAPPAALPDARIDASPPPDAATGFSETFPGPNAASWPAPWSVLGDRVAAQTVVDGRGRLVPVPSGYALARMGVTGAWREVDATFEVTFDDLAVQGVGFYVRQNGGLLMDTTPHGQGYAVFIEGYRGQRIGVWREIDGNEQEILPQFTAFASPLVSATPYRVRFRVTQASATATRLQARIWLASAAEPSTWQVDLEDTSAVLQNLAGGIAVDCYNDPGAPAPTAALVDNIVVTPL